jgi:hypothetical protein
VRLNPSKSKQNKIIKWQINLTIKNVVNVCYSKNVGLERIEGYYSGCQGHSHFFKKNG